MCEECLARSSKCTLVPKQNLLAKRINTLVFRSGGLVIGVWFREPSQKKIVKHFKTEKHTKLKAS